MTKRRKKELPRDGGLSKKQIQQLRSAIREIWMWSYARKLVIKRCETKDGFSRCEGCKRKVAKVFVDHIEACGDVEDGGYLERTFRASRFLQGLCSECHKLKTKKEREESQW